MKEDIFLMQECSPVNRLRVIAYLVIVIIFALYVVGCSGGDSPSFEFEGNDSKLPVVSVKTEMEGNLKVGESPPVRCLLLDAEGNKIAGKEGDTTISFFPNDFFATSKEGKQIARRVGRAVAVCHAPKYGIRDLNPLSFDIVHGDPVKTRVVLEKDIVSAGSDVTYQCQVFDAYGNLIESAISTVSVSPEAPSSSLSDESLHIEKSGLYSVTCSSTGVAEMEAKNLEIQAGEPVAIDIVVDPMESYYKLNQVVTIKAQLLDSYGNEVNDGASLSLYQNPNGDSEVAKHLFGNQYQLNTEGEYVFYAQAELKDGTQLEVEKKLLVNGQGPKVTCKYPKNGDLIQGNLNAPIEVSVTAKDVVGVQSVKINEVEVANVDGVYQHSIVPTFGMNYYKVTALDDTGDESSRICSFIYAPYYMNSGSDYLNDTVTISLDQDAIDDNDRSSINSVGDILHRVINSDEIEETIGNSLQTSLVKGVEPIKSASEFRFYGDISTKGMLGEEGLYLEFHIPKLSVHLKGKAGIVSGQGTIYVHSVDIGIWFNVDVENGQIVVSSYRVASVSVGSVKTESWAVNKALEAINMNEKVANSLRTYLQNNFKETLNQHILSTLNLNDFATNFTTPSFSGENITTSIGMQFSYANIDSMRFRVGVATKISPLFRQEFASKGAPYLEKPNSYALPMGLTSRVDIYGALINQALYSIWAGGMLKGEFVATDPDGTFKVGSKITFHGLLPPVAVIKDHRDIEVSLGALQLSVMIPGFFETPISVDIGVRVKAFLDKNASGQLYLENPEMTDFYLTTLSGEMSDEHRTILQEKLKTIIAPMINQFVTAALPSIPIPGFTFPQPSAYNLPAGRKLTVQNPMLSTSNDRVVLEGSFGLDE